MVMRIITSNHHMAVIAVKGLTPVVGKSRSSTLEQYIHTYVHTYIKYQFVNNIIKLL